MNDNPRFKIQAAIAAAILASVAVLGVDAANAGTTPPASVVTWPIDVVRPPYSGVAARQATCNAGALYVAPVHYSRVGDPHLGNRYLPRFARLCQTVPGDGGYSTTLAGGRAVTYWEGHVYIPSGRQVVTLAGGNGASSAIVDRAPIVPAGGADGTGPRRVILTGPEVVPVTVQWLGEKPVWISVAPAKQGR